MSENRVLISEAAARLNRQIGTIRKWERLGILPENLRPQRDERDWRYWTNEQIDAIKIWMRDTDLRPGKGLLTYQFASQEKVDEHVRNMRVPKAKQDSVD